ESLPKPNNCGNQVNPNAVAEENILNAVEADPSISVRKLSARFHCPRKVHRNRNCILFTYKRFMHFFMQIFHVGWNFQTGFDVCTEIMQTLSVQSCLPTKLDFLSMDVTHHQHQFQPIINVWAGIIGQHLIGPYKGGSRGGHGEDLPFAKRQAMWFMHDEAPPHFSQAVRKHLYVNQKTLYRRGGPVA
ncbi:hypothetical protein YQE_05796, partial [Dendroctonus ponderosae]